MNHQNTNKRPRPESPRAAHPSSPPQSTPPDSTAGTHPHHSASSSFRNVSACNRCRLRKNRCDQNLPACSSCEKANVKCVGFDPITKREIPRAYVYYLESRVSYLEDILNSKHIPFSAADDFDAGTSRPSLESSLNSTGSTSPTVDRHAPLHSIHSVGEGEGRRKEEDKLNKLVSNIHMDSGPYQHRGSIQNTGVSFARVVFAAVRSSV